MRTHDAVTGTPLPPVFRVGEWVTMPHGALFGVGHEVRLGDGPVMRVVDIGRDANGTYLTVEPV